MVSLKVFIVIRLLFRITFMIEKIFNIQGWVYCTEAKCFVPEFKGSGLG